MSFIITILAALLVFSAVIAIHEFGHFTVAKLCGIQVNEFSIGMGPVLWKKNHKGTQYSLRALPVGGFVALEGEESPESQQAEAAHTVQEQPAPETEASVQPTGVPLNEAPVWQRALVMVAGAVMNFVLGFVVLVILIARLLLRRSEQGRLFLAAGKLRRSPLRRLHQMNAASQFASTMATMLSAGLPVQTVLGIVSQISDNYVFSLGVRKVKEGVERGRGIADSMEGVECFPKMLTEMVAVGERSGSLEETLDVIGDYFDHEAATMTERLLAVLEPVIIIVLAAVTVILLLAVYLPMFSMYGGM